MPQDRRARGAVAIDGLGIALDALNYRIVVAGLASRQVFVHMLCALEKSPPLLAPDPAVAARPYREATGAWRQVVNVSRNLKPDASVAGAVRMGAAVIRSGRRATRQGAVQAARPLPGGPHRTRPGQAQRCFRGKGSLLMPLSGLFDTMRGQTGNRVVGHEARSSRHAGLIRSSGPYHRALAQQLLCDPPKGPWGQVEHVWLSAVANIEAVAFGEEIGVAPDLGPPCVKMAAYFIVERCPGGRFASFHGGKVCLNRGPQRLPGLVAQFRVEHAGQHEETVSLELGYLVRGQKRDLFHARIDRGWL